MARIVSATLYHVVMDLREGFETSFGRVRRRHGVLVKLVDEDGLEGWGEIPVDEEPRYSCETVETAMHAAREFLAPQLLRLGEPSPRRFSESVAWVRGHKMAKAGFEAALWDLEARRAGKPLYRLLGGVRDRIESGVSIGVIGDMGALLRSVAEYLGKGYRRIKIKIKPGWDVEPVKTIRREYGDIPLQVDANASYSLGGAGSLLELDGYGLLMIEQPLHYEDLAEHAELQSRMKTPICLDESVSGLPDLKAAAKLGSCRVLNIKPARVGGISESLALHDYAQKIGMPVWIGGMLETGVGRGFLVALASLPNVRFPSDISASDRYYEEDVVEPPWALEKDGTIRAPSLPGIGVEVLEERIARISAKTVLVTA